MKIAVTLTICLLLATGGQTNNFLDSVKSVAAGVGDAFKQTFSSVGDQVKVLGSQLLDQLKQQGGQLASQALQSLALNAMNALQGTSAPATKRDVDIHKIADEAQEFVENHMDMLKGVLMAASGKFKDIPNHVGPMTADEIINEIENIVQSHNGLVDKIGDNLIHGLVDKFAAALQQHGHKRSSFTDALNSVTNSLATFFKPHLDTLKTLVSGTGDALKQTVNTFNSVSNPHYQAISNSTGEIAKHGANALHQLQGALAEVMQTALTNMAPHIQTLVQHGAQALGEAAGNFVQNLANGATTPPQ